MLLMLYIIFKRSENAKSALLRHLDLNFEAKTLIKSPFQLLFFVLHRLSQIFAITSSLLAFAWLKLVVYAQNHQK